MGLLSRIEGADYINRSVSSILSFNDFFSKNPLNCFCILKCTNGKYFVNNSFGFDIETIINFTSSVSTWNQIIPEENKIYSFNIDTILLQPFYQFFSRELRTSLKTVILYKNKDNIYVICETTSSLDDYQESINDLIFFDNNSFSNRKTFEPSEFQKFSLDFSSAINKELLLEQDNKEIYEVSIFNNLSNILQTYFPSPNVVEKQGLILNIYFKAEDSISDNLFLSLIKQNLKDFLAKSFDYVELKSK